MFLPCSPANNFTLRFVVLNFKSNDLYYQNDKGMPDGPYLRFALESFLWNDYKTIIKYCKFIFVDFAGVYHSSNDSYTGGYGLIQRSEADTFFRGTDYYLEDKFAFTGVGMGTYLFAAQLIERKIKEDDSLSTLLDFFVPSIEFSSLLIASLIVYFSFSFFTSKFQSLNSLVSANKFGSKFILKCLSFLFVIFIFFIDNLMNSNLSTSSVIVDTSDLLDSLDKVIKTDKELCLFEKEAAENDYYINENAPKGILANRLYMKINKTDLCYISAGDRIGNIFHRDRNKIFFFMYDAGMDTLSKSIRAYFKKDVFASLPIYENVKSTIMPKTVSYGLRKFIDTWLYRMYENELYQGFFKFFPDYSGTNLLKNLKDYSFSHYANVQDYIDDFTITKAISFEKLEYLFFAYFGFLILILSIYLIDHLINFLKSLIN